MDFVTCVIVALISALQCLEGKPSKQSSTDPGFPSQLANDGDIESLSSTGWQSNPYWEGDLGGYFNVTKITVTSDSIGWAGYLRGAVIEIAASSMSTCPESTNTFRCGQWPDADLSGVSITFNCTYSAVRYVRIRREVKDYLIIAEVAAEGDPSIPPGQGYYEKRKSKKVTTPTKSLSVGKVTECGTMCSRNQPCLAFSFSKSQTPNCLLAIDSTMASHPEWISYKLNECMEMPTTCPPIG